METFEETSLAVKLSHSHNLVIEYVVQADEPPFVSDQTKMLLSHRIKKFFDDMQVQNK